MAQVYYFLSSTDLEMAFVRVALVFATAAGPVNGLQFAERKTVDTVSRGKEGKIEPVVGVKRGGEAMPGYVNNDNDNNAAYLKTGSYKVEHQTSVKTWLLNKIR